MSCERSNQQVLIRDSPGSLTWPTQTKKFLPKKFPKIPPPPSPPPPTTLKKSNKKIFQTKKFSHLLEPTNFLPKEKILY